MAKAAKVSPSTVSRVIKNHPSISNKTVALVQTKMKELGYVPNLTARSLVTKKTYTIGIILKSASQMVRQNPFYGDVLHGIIKECNDSNYAIKTTVSNTEETLYKEILNMIITQSVDGFILLYSINDDSIKQLLIEKEIPFVVLGKALYENDDDIIHIDNDNEKAGRDICHYLYRLGHRNIVFIVETGNYAVTNDRAYGFELEAQYNDISYQIIESENDKQKLKTLIKTHVISQNQTMRPTAIVTSDSVLHHTLLSVLYDYKIRIPDDINTATFNDSFLTARGTPSQTTVAIYPVNLGIKASEKIIQLINNKQISKQNITLPTHIIERQSTNKNEE